MTSTDQRSGDWYTYTGEHLREVAFPLGGIGTGSVCLTGRGAFEDWEIFNRPNKGSILPLAMALLWCRAHGEAPQTRVIQGPRNKEFIGTLGHGDGDYGRGQIRNHGDGLPHFRSAVFRGTFPFATIDFEHPACPLDVSLRAVSPFIPLDSKSSSMPVACLTYRLTNRRDVPVEANLAFNLPNPVNAMAPRPTDDDPDRASNTFRSGDDCRGFIFTNDRFAPDSPYHGTAALTTDWPNVTYLTGWHGDGAWDFGTDSLQRFWALFSPDGQLDPKRKFEPGERTGGTLGLTVTLQPGASVELPLLISWCFPNFIKYWNNADAPESDWPVWTNWYATVWPDAWAVAEDFFKRRTELVSRSEAFERALLDCTLPPEVIESVGATASILRSTTVLRLTDGTLYGFEGCTQCHGCCEGSCTHVWNYAVTHAQLFPDLARSMRQADYAHGFSADEGGQKGVIAFRIQLPLQQRDSWSRAAADGQLGTVVQLYRDWRFCGDDDYLKRLWPAAKKALEYAWVEWDRDRDGLVDGEQHNTYDIEFHGPNPLMQLFYLAALRAGEQMAQYLGDRDAAAQYRRVHQAGRKKTEKQLFNGEYFEQTIDCLADDAPPWQHGKGCLTDQVFGQLAAHLAGLGYVVDRKQIRAALEAVFACNYLDPLGDHVNMQRIYCMADEPGLLLCTWPRGDRPVFAFPYCDEVWSGIGYQVAAHMVYEGMTDEALCIVRSIRKQYDGARRNPYNEFECGSHYARALASWGVLLALSGFRYDAVDRTIHLTPRGPDARNMRCVFTTNSAWGVFAYNAGRMTLDVIEGELTVQRIVTDTGELPIDAAPITIRAGARAQFGG